MGRGEEEVTLKKVSGRRKKAGQQEREKGPGKVLVVERSGGRNGEGGQRPRPASHGPGLGVDRTHPWRSILFPSILPVLGQRCPTGAGGWRAVEANGALV